MKHFYKGDIVQREKTPEGITLKHYWCADLIGVNNTVNNIEGYHLWYRPLRNHFKYMVWYTYHYVATQLSEF